VTEGASLALRHVLKNSVVESLISIRAKCTPRQTLEPSPKGEYTALAASVIREAFSGFKSLNGSHRLGSNLVLWLEYNSAQVRTVILTFRGPGIVSSFCGGCRLALLRLYRRAGSVPSYVHRFLELCVADRQVQHRKDAMSLR
jgi:hypothetical protein